MITMWNGSQANGAIIALWGDITFTTERYFQMDIMLGFFVEQIVEIISGDITSNCLGGAGLMVHSWEADWTFMVSGIMHIITPPVPYYTILYHAILDYISLPMNFVCISLLPICTQFLSSFATFVNKCYEKKNYISDHQTTQYLAKPCHHSMSFCPDILSWSHHTDQKSIGVPISDIKYL